MSGGDYTARQERARQAHEIADRLLDDHRLTDSGRDYAFKFARWRLDLRPTPPDDPWPGNQGQRLREWVDASIQPASAGG